MVRKNDAFEGELILKCPNPNCKSKNIIKNGIINMAQRYKCKECRYTFTLHPTTTDTIKRKALKMYQENYSLRSVAAKFKSNAVTVSKWIKEMGETNDLYKIRQAANNTIEKQGCCEQSPHKMESELKKPAKSNIVERELGLITARLLKEYAIISQVSSVEIFTIIQTILDVKSKNNFSIKNSFGRKPNITPRVVKDWRNKLWKLSIYNKDYSDNTHNAGSGISESFTLYVTDYSIHTANIKYAVLVGYEIKTRTLFSAIKKNAPSGYITFEEPKFFDFIFKARNHLETKIGRPKSEDMPLHVKVLSSGNDIAIDYKNNIDRYKRNGKKYIPERNSGRITKVKDRTVSSIEYFLKGVKSIPKLALDLELKSNVDINLSDLRQVVKVLANDINSSLDVMSMIQIIERDLNLKEKLQKLKEKRKVDADGNVSESNTLELQEIKKKFPETFASMRKSKIEWKVLT